MNVGKVSSGMSSTNFNNILFNHGHGTHTEFSIMHAFYSVNQASNSFLLPMVSVELEDRRDLYYKKAIETV
jgi:hypothetical protein